MVREDQEAIGKLSSYVEATSKKPCVECMANSPTIVATCKVEECTVYQEWLDRDEAAEEAREALKFLRAYFDDQPPF